MSMTLPPRPERGPDAASAPSPRIHYVHADAPLCSLDEGALAGLRHRTVIDSRTGAAGLALWQEEHLPGFEVPLHFHDCEEIISVLHGWIEARLGAERLCVTAGESILIPARMHHGFRVIGKSPVRLLALFASPNPDIFRTDGARSLPPWEGGESDHLDSGKQRR